MSADGSTTASPGVSTGLDNTIPGHDPVGTRPQHGDGEILRQRDAGRTVLRMDDIHLSFGGVKALQGVSVEVAAGELLAIIGPNGAGKTCLLNCVNGYYCPDGGKILFHDHDITGLPSDRVAKLGVARTFQHVELYAGMTVLENLLAGRHSFMRSGLLASLFYYGPAHREEMRQREVVEQIIDFLEIQPIRRNIVGSLPYGLRKRVELGRALAMEPKLLLLDEPMAGMNVEEKEDMARFILDVWEERSIPILIIEHDMQVVMDIAERVIVLDFGHKIAEGPPSEVRSNPKVVQAYLGEEWETAQT